MPYDFMQVDYQNVPDLNTFDEGAKETVRITGFQVDEPGFWIRVTLECPSDEMSKDISHFISIPHPDDPPKKRNFKLHMIEDFTTAFGLSNDEWLDPETWSGRQAEAILGTKNDEKFGNQNTIKQLFAPE